jgi:hypothetical protein
MNDPDNDTERLAAFERRTRELLNASAAALDGRVRSKLTQARFAAVEEARRGRGSFVWRSWVPVGSLAGAAVLALLLWNGDISLNRHDSGQTQNPLDDLDLMTADENLEMIEDLEFYQWLDSEPRPDSLNGAGTGS